MARGRKWSRRRWLLTGTAALLLLVALAPTLIVRPIVCFKIRQALERPRLGLICREVSTDLCWYRLFAGTSSLAVRGLYLGRPFEARSKFGFSSDDGLRLRGRARAGFPDTAWQVHVKFSAGLDGWRCEATMPEHDFDERDPLLRTVLGRYPVAAVSNLCFRGSVGLTAVASCRDGAPVVSWQAKAPVRRLSAEMVAGDREISVGGLSVFPEISGQGAHLDVHPVRLAVSTLSVAGFSVSNVYAQVWTDRRDIMVSEAGASCCGGKLRLYALSLDPQKLSGGFSLYVEDVESKRVLEQCRGFEGECTGRLNGKLSLMVHEGRSIRLRDAYLQSPPGGIGTLRLRADSPFTANLDLSGLDDAACENLKRALADLDYTVLRLDLRRESEKQLALTVRLEGTAGREKLKVPVSLKLTVRGDFEQLVNTSLKFNQERKDTRQ